MSSEYERGYWDAVEAAKRIADTKSDDLRRAIAPGALIAEEIGARIAALTPTPPPDAAQPSPPPPAGGERTTVDGPRPDDTYESFVRRNMAKAVTWQEAYDDAAEACTTWASVCAMSGNVHGERSARECARRIGLNKAQWESYQPPPAPQGDDESTLRDALDRLIKAAWRKPGELVRSCFTIPPDEKRDADVILERAITELLALRANGGPR
jgi:hypothetical protein